MQALRSLAALKRGPAVVVPYLRSKKELEGVAAAACLGAAAAAGPFDVEGDRDHLAVTSPDMDALVGALSTSTPFLVRAAAEMQLAAIGDRAVHTLARAATRAATIRERRSAIRALGATQSKYAVPAVTLAFADEEPWIRFQARLAAEQLLVDLPKDATRDLVAALEKSIASEADPLVRRLLDRSRDARDAASRTPSAK
jgi:hypothetical protein